jgi:hypothetical protein
VSRPLKDGDVARVRMEANVSPEVRAEVDADRAAGESRGDVIMRWAQERQHALAPTLTMEQARNRGAEAGFRVVNGAPYVGPDARVKAAGEAHQDAWFRGYYDQQ